MAKACVINYDGGLLLLKVCFVKGGQLLAQGGPRSIDENYIKAVLYF
jgi:hypothetical protein